MKKLLLGLAIAIVGLSGTNTPAGATDGCSISNTGPGSDNSCVVKDDFTCKVETDNKFTIINTNTQEATSGSATVSGNTTGGNATSGSATNSNGTVISIEVINEACVITAVTPPAPITPAPVGGSGSVAPAAQPRPVGGMGAVAPVAAPQKAAPAVLPETSTESTLGIIASLVALLGAAILGSRAAISAYSKMQS